MDRTSRFAVGCDLGGTRLKTVLLDRGRLKHESVQLVPTDSAASILDTLVEAVRAALDGRPPASLGIAVPGFLDPRRRTIELLANLPVLDGYPLASRMGRRLSRRLIGPPVLDADSNAGAYAEATRGTAQRSRRVLYLSLGTGVSAAMVCDGCIQRVSRHTVGQIAHLPLEVDGCMCSCGRRGCVEATLSARGIVWRARRRGLRGPAAGSPEAVFDAAQAGAAEARAVWRDVGNLVGDISGRLAGLWDPDHVVVGGGIAGAAGLFLKTARARLDRKLPPRLRGHVQLDRSHWGAVAGAVGAALIGADHAFPKT